MYVGRDRRKRAVGGQVRGVVQPTAEDGDELLRLQHLAGNRAVTDHVVQREGMTAEEKKQRLKGLKEKPRSGVTEYALKTALGDVWTRYANLNQKDAKERCQIAATDISTRLRAAGIAHDIFGVVWWPSWGAGSLNHYVVVAQDMVIDATGQQFNGGIANITPYSTWMSELKSRIPQRILARYVRGTYEDAKELTGIGMETYFEQEHLGQPLYDYDPAFVARVRRMVAARGN